MHVSDSSDQQAAPVSSSRRLVHITSALLVLGGALMIFSTTSCQSTVFDLPRPVTYKKLQFLDQGWTEQDRATYYHTAQGTTILPYAWVMALEKPLSNELFMAPENVSRYRLLPDPDTTNNPDQLPVGVTKDMDPGNKEFAGPYFGLTCAACHTGQLTYQGTAVRLDGGASQQDLVRFVKEMVTAFLFTAADLGDKWTRFETKVTALGYPKAGLREAVLKKVGSMAAMDTEDHLHGIFPVLDGFGRQDALGRGGNNGFRNIGIYSNLAVSNASVSFPAVWEAVNWDWVQYNTSIQQPLGRNIGEVLGVGGRITLQSSLPDKSDLYDSSVNIAGLQTIETTIRKLKAPKWPADVLGAIDQAKAAKGATLFAQNCAGCHDNHKPDPTHPGDWLVRVIPVDEIGTDPNQAMNLKNHMLDPGQLRLPSDPPAPAKLSAGAMLKRVTDNVAARKLKETYPDPVERAAKQAEMTFGRDNNWRDTAPATPPNGATVDTLVYRAHSLHSIWATPPYLHNGSVPNITMLLSPVEERPKEFVTGNIEYDPVNLGYQTTQPEGGGGFVFKVAKAGDPATGGNANTGHEFANKPKGHGVIGRLLSPDERAAIIEYLKTR